MLKQKELSQFPYILGQKFVRISQLSVKTWKGLSQEERVVVP